MPDDLVWIYRGGPEHNDGCQTSDGVATWFPRIDRGLNLIAWTLESRRDDLTELTTGNELAAVACFTRAFRGLRSAGILAMEGLYQEARAHLRGVYESAGLGRMLATEPAKAEQWLSKGRWFPDREVRRYIHDITMPGTPVEESPYREYYKQASDLVHPTARSTIWMAWDLDRDACRPRLISEFDENTLSEVLREIAAEATFVCFAIVRAAEDEGAIPVGWRRELKNLAEEIALHGDWSHLERDWQREQNRFESIVDNILPDVALDEVLERHPNSMRNIRKRMGES